MPDATPPPGLPCLPPRAAEAHKGDFGSVLVVGGSRGMAGAVVLAAQAAMRAGAGKVTAAVPESLYPIVAAQVTVCTTASLAEQPNGTLAKESCVRLAEMVGDFDAVAFGPGLGLNTELVEVVRWVVSHVDLPIIIDADGLNCVAAEPGLLQARPAPTVLTPHPKELSRLSGLTVDAIQSDRPAAAQAFAQRTGTVVVLKGRGTVVAEGERTYVNATGNPGMATGGSGDVLTGIIAALVGQGLKPFDAARLGVYIHGLAGDLARDAVGEVSLIATDIVDHLSAAFRRHAEGT